MDNQRNKDILYYDLLRDIEYKMSKCCYKRIIKSLLLHDDFCHSHFDLQLFRIRALSKIIKRKRKKYTYRSEHQFSRFNFWLSYMQKELSCLFDLVNEDGFDENKQAKMIEYYLRYLYDKCSIDLQSDNIPVALAYLGISLKFINLYLPYARNVNILFLMQKHLMIISKVLIQNGDYASSYLYIKKIINIGIKIILFQTNLNDDIAITITSTDTSNKTKLLNKTMIHIIQAVMNNGICKEQLGEITNAIRWYNGSHWISQSIFHYDNLVVLFTNRLLIRSIEMKSVLVYLKCKNKELKEKRRLLLIQEENERQKKSMKTHFFYRDYKIQHRLERTEKRVSSMDISDVKVFTSNEKNSHNKYMLSHLYLIDTYLSDGFREFIDNSKTIPIANIDYERKHQIESILRKHKQNDTSNKTRNNRKSITSTIGSLKQPTYISTSSKNDTTQSRNNLLTRYNSSKSPCLASNRSNYNQKIEYKNSYKKKRRYLDDLNSRELKFQKELLNMKKKEIKNEDSIDKYQINQEADFVVKQMRRDNSLLLFNDNNKAYSMNEIKRIKMFMSLENKILKSLCPKQFKKYLKEKNHKTSQNDHFSNHINTSSLIELLIPKKNRITTVGSTVSSDFNDIQLNMKRNYKRRNRLKSASIENNVTRMKSI